MDVGKINQFPTSIEHSQWVVQLKNSIVLDNPGCKLEKIWFVDQTYSKNMYIIYMYNIYIHIYPKYGNL